jgi:hypothetical protein
MKKKSTLFGTGLIIGMVILVIGILVVLALTNTIVISGSDSLNKFLADVDQIGSTVLKLWSEFSTWAWGILQQMLQQFGQLTSRN